MNPLLDKIRSCGYWRVVIRPTTFVEKRVQDRSTLEHILRKTSVYLHGWSFPHVDDFREFDSGSDWIGQEIEWDSILEFWRFYQSGQFAYFSKIVGDPAYSSNRCVSSHKTRGNLYVDVREVVARLTEIFEFAARLSFTEVGDTTMHLEIALANFGEYLIRTPSHPGLPYRICQAHEPEMTYKADISSAELVTNKGDLALKAALKSFRCFGWDPSHDMLHDMQAGILNRNQSLDWIAPH